jgi:hypothetical protein
MPKLKRLLVSACLRPPSGGALLAEPGARYLPG